jgi:hypothetical protein
VRGEELDPLERQSSPPDLVFKDSPSLAGSMLEEGHFPALHQGYSSSVQDKIMLGFIAWKYTSFL